jgi:hypothetical protein
MTLPLEEAPGGSTYMSGGEMTQEEKAKAYDAYVRGNKAAWCRIVASRGNHPRNYQRKW